MGTCYKCSRVERCKEPEAAKGRIINAKQHVIHCQQKLKQALVKLGEKLDEAPCGSTQVWNPKTNQTVRLK
jgi:hypothetical protein